MALFAKDEIEVRNLLRIKLPPVEPPELIYEVEITDEREAQKKNRDVRNQEKRVGWEAREKAREKGVLCDSICCDEADAKIRSCLFLCKAAEGQRQVRQKRPSLDLHAVTTKKLHEDSRRGFCDNQNLSL